LNLFWGKIWDKLDFVGFIGRLIMSDPRFLFRIKRVRRESAAGPAGTVEAEMGDLFGYPASFFPVSSHGSIPVIARG
jgi:hypothetical protein